MIPVNVEQILKEEEHPEERENLSCMRQVQVRRRSPRLIKRLIRQAHQEQKGSTLQGDGSTMPEHLRDLFERSSEGWTVSEQDTIRRLLMQYQDVCSKNEFDLGQTHLVEHCIDMGDAKPISQPPRRVPFAFADVEKRQIGKMLNAGLVRPSTLPWASPVCLVWKPDGSP